jgi:primosomal protein N' (replication factor Y)
VPGHDTRAYASVALNVPLDTLFDYRVPEPLRADIAPGARVRVPFGRREMIGYCVAFPDAPGCPEDRIKDIHQLLDRPALLDERMLKLTRWMASYYCCSWGEALDAVLPAGVRKRRAPRTVLMVCALREPADLRRGADELRDRAPRQARTLAALAATRGEIAAGDLLDLAGADHAVLPALERDGWLRTRRQRQTADPSLEFRVDHSDPPPLTPDQRRVLDRVDAALARNAFHVALLHGVTGSGKTEVYLQALDRVVRAGRQGIVLVPEIALTPQTVARFRGRFDRVCVLHSELAEGARRDQWMAIRRGEADVVIGARSAVFAPVPRLGLLIVDEEHETTFKQASAPRYHGRDAGIWRARQEGALVLLGSATPSLESLLNARTGKYELLELPRRVGGRPLPPVEVLDLAQHMEKGRSPLLSRRLRVGIETALAKGEQVILFLNRRGYNTHVHCPRCGFALKCEHCSVSLIFHRSAALTRCHYCGAQAEPPGTCPGCNAANVKYVGSGTERVEEEIGKLFGPAAVARMDRDSMQGVDKYRETLDDFRDGKTQILLGTQMVAKGLDFPNVTLVGVVNADTSLNLPDFRASERTFQLLAQVAGRAGRGDRGGRVIVQTWSPDHPCIHEVVGHDYASFARRELEERRRCGYPPFTRLARLLFEGKKADAVQAACAGAVAAAKAACPDVRVLGPALAPIERIKGLTRWHALLKAPDSPRLHKALAALDRRKQGGIDMTIDVDPVAML